MPAFLDRLSYVRSLVVTAPLVAVVTVLMGSLSLASSLVDSTGRIQHSCARWWGRMILRVCGVRLAVSSDAPLSEAKTYVFCVNHQSHMDIPVVLAAIPIPFRFAAKKELFSIPFLGWHLRRSGHIAIDRRNPHAAVKSFRGASERLRGGVSLVFFPEGGTSLDGSIKPFKGGGFVLAEQAQAAIVPVTVRGSRAVLLPKTQHVRGGRVEVILGTPIESEGHSPKELTVRVREQIVTTFENGKTLDRNTHTFSR
jgi:1-acyl-sn-glycerol-3-phosphate acyltransferase